ncbi:MAG: TonB-dependent receptor [Flavobacteriia bacterium]|nr:TonB-dependent receptor [Flavobacteriia bacterium]
MYSMGLHQGVSGIEEGSNTLDSEKSAKLTLNTDWYINERVFLQALGYYQYITDYIFLAPQEEFRLTIRGAFPVFKYEQTNARIWGTDFLGSYEISDQLKYTVKYAIVRINDRSTGFGIINTPADNISNLLRYEAYRNDRGDSFFLQVAWQYVLRQSRVAEAFDFLEAPEDYSLINLRAGIDFHLDQGIMEFEIYGDNILNTRYRDYLNRLRYYADDLGINFGIRLNWKWGN